MGALVITTNMSLDGVIEDPDGKEGFRRGGWFSRFGASDLDDWAELETGEAMTAAAILLGRNSDEWFAARWNGRTGAWADRLNALPKYVVSTRPDAPSWANATVLSGDVVARIAEVKDAADGEVLVYASYQLARTLLEHDLVDELRLVVFPVVLGAGDRLFGPTTDVKPLRLRSARALGQGLVFLAYDVVKNEVTP
jgi:dihydrofolate reductase